MLAAVALLGVVTAGAGMFYLYRLSRRPPRVPVVRSLFQGVTYERLVRNSPRPVLMHLVEVDLTAEGIDFVVTPPGAESVSASKTFKDLKVPADTVSGFLVGQGVQVAINGSYFTPHHVQSPLHYYPKVGELAYPKGVAVSSGDRYSPAEEGWAALCILNPRDIRIADYDCPTETQQGIAGDLQFIKDGQFYTGGLEIVEGNADRLMPRTAIAINQATTKLWLVVVDGRQKGYSEGVTLPELSELLISLGADRALNLDGGGSSTLVIDEGGVPSVLSAPIQARLPMMLRPVANHFGVYALPLESVGPVNTQSN
ncbi:MAG: phosphodiester glycosidase family protein [Cyanobacteria bacterium J06649_5]